MNSAEHRARIRRSQCLAHEVVKCAEAQRADRQALEPFGQDGALEPERRVVAVSSATREQEAGALAVEPSQREPEHGGGGGIEPLHVVDRNDDRLVTGEGSKRAEQRETDRALVGSRAAGALEQ